MESKNRHHTATLDITTFRGTCATAKHYYGTLHIIDDDSIALTRPITTEEIEQDSDRFYYYDPGDDTKCFNSWKDVVTAAGVIIRQKGLDPNTVYVSGIPNTDCIPFSKALQPLDTRPKCKKCGKVIEPGNGCYNTPNGLFCIPCYESAKRK